MIMSALYNTKKNEVVRTSRQWVGRPIDRDFMTYALFPAAMNDTLKERWYSYSDWHDAKLVNYEDLPEAVRLAHMLLN